MCIDRQGGRGMFVRVPLNLALYLVETRDILEVLQNTELEMDIRDFGK